MVQFPRAGIAIVVHFFWLSLNYRCRRPSCLQNGRGHSEKSTWGGSHTVAESEVTKAGVGVREADEMDEASLSMSNPHARGGTNARLIQEVPQG